MGLIRLIFLLLIAGVIWYMVKNYLHKQELRARKDQVRVSAEKIVRCSFCEVHLPEQQAVHVGDDWFCTQAHRQAWLSRDDKS